jgi:hypothetical protein
MRIEFVLKRHYNSIYLTLDNIEGDYSQIIERFIDYLAQLYKKYFLGLILVDASNSGKYPFFSRIYNMALSLNYYGRDRIRTSLENYAQEKKKNDKMTDFQKYNKIINELGKDKRKNDKLLENPPDNYFYGLKDMSMLNAISPFDIQDKDKIEFQDGDFTFFKDSWISPDMKVIENKEENQ